MNLNTIAEQDLAFTLEDSENGFGVDIVLRSPNNSYPVTMQTTDIGFFIDIQSGTAIQGRTVECVGRISTLVNLAGGLPGKNWLVDFVDTNENTWSMKVANVIPDRKIGVYKLVLELFDKNVNL